ncbi:hypothetical protein EV363DRAFT_1419710 [Boletus edulis]|nr:hypothetical protein EV363DRAFT_1419710 [Boletus edulis]
MVIRISAIGHLGASQFVAHWLFEFINEASRQIPVAFIKAGTKSVELRKTRRRKIPPCLFPIALHSATGVFFVFTGRRQCITHSHLDSESSLGKTLRRTRPLVPDWPKSVTKSPTIRVKTGMKCVFKHTKGQGSSLDVITASWQCRETETTRQAPELTCGLDLEGVFFAVHTHSQIWDQRRIECATFGRSLVVEKTGPLGKPFLQHKVVGSAQIKGSRKAWMQRCSTVEHGQGPGVSRNDRIASRRLGIRTSFSISLLTYNHIAAPSLVNASDAAVKSPCLPDESWLDPLYG